MPQNKETHDYLKQLGVKKIKSVGNLKYFGETKNKININSRMVRLGYAVAYKKYSKKYLSAEREAKREELGLWKGTFDMPWDWRKNVKK